MLDESKIWKKKVTIGTSGGCSAYNAEEISNSREQSHLLFNKAKKKNCWSNTNCFQQEDNLAPDAIRTESNFAKLVDVGN